MALLFPVNAQNHHSNWEDCLDITIFLVVSQDGPFQHEPRMVQHLGCLSVRHSFNIMSILNSHTGKWIYLDDLRKDEHNCLILS